MLRRKRQKRVFPTRVYDLRSKKLGFCGPMRHSDFSVSLKNLERQRVKRSHDVTLENKFIIKKKSQPVKIEQ